MQPEAQDVAGHLPVWQRFGEYVCCHVVGWAILDVNCTAGHDLTDEVEANVDVLRPSVVVIICSQLQSCLIVAMQCGLGIHGGK